MNGGDSSTVRKLSFIPLARPRPTLRVGAGTCIPRASKEAGLRRAFRSRKTREVLFFFFVSALIFNLVFNLIDYLVSSEHPEFRSCEVGYIALVGFKNPYLFQKPFVFFFDGLIKENDPVPFLFIPVDVNKAVFTHRGKNNYHEHGGGKKDKKPLFAFFVQSRHCLKDYQSHGKKSNSFRYLGNPSRKLSPKNFRIYKKVPAFALPMPKCVLKSHQKQIGFKEADMKTVRTAFLTGALMALLLAVTPAFGQMMGEKEGEQMGGMGMMGGQTMKGMMTKEQMAKEHHQMLRDMLGMMKEISGILKNMTHAPTAEDKRKLTEMMDRVDNMTKRLDEMDEMMKQKKEMREERMEEREKR